MRVGFAVRYGHNTSTYVSCCLSDLLEAHGIECGIGSHIAPKRVHSRYDGKLARLRNTDELSVWCQCHSHIVFPYPPHRNTLDFCQSVGVRTIVVVPPINFCPENQDLGADVLISCCKEVDRYLRRDCKRKNATLIPWRPDFASYTSKPNTKLRLFVPLHYCSIQLVDDSILSVVAKALRQHRDMEALLSISKVAYKGPVSQAVRRLARDFPERVTVAVSELIDDSFEEQYRQSDIILDPSLHTDIPSTSFNALAAGKPVVAYDVSPVTEPLRHEYNAVLAPCDIVRRKAEVSALPNRTGLEAALFSLIDNRRTLFRMSEACRESVIDSRERFEQAWMSVFQS